MKKMTKLAIGAVGGVIAASWVRRLFGERDALRRENSMLVSRCEALETKAERLSAEAVSLRAENSRLRAELQALAKPAMAKR